MPGQRRTPAEPAMQPAFELADEVQLDAPLAARMRPRSLDEFSGQEAAVGPNSMLRKAVQAGRLPSVILWGPPGCGKTTLARILARSVNAHFVQISAVSSGVADLRKVVAEAKARRMGG
jgi:putative ATPase